MFVRMSWKEAEKRFEAGENFVLTGGNNSNPITVGERFYAHDYCSSFQDVDFITVLESVSLWVDACVQCWKQVPDGVEEPDGNLYCMKVWDRQEQHFATAYAKGESIDAVKLEADYRGYTVVQIEERMP